MNGRTEKMECKLFRGRPRTFEAWVVDVNGCEYPDEDMLYTFSNRKLALGFIRLCKAGYLPSENYRWIVEHPSIARACGVN